MDENEIIKEEKTLVLIEENNNKSKNYIPFFFIGFCLVIFTISAFLYFDTINAGGESLRNAYKSAYDFEREKAYTEIYDFFFDYAEKEYHVSNKVSIYIGDLQEQQNLEVLKVSDVEYIIEEKTDNSSNIISWIEVPGNGTFVVNLQAAEYIIDNSRSYILVRAPYPELRNVEIDYSNVRKLLFKDDMFNGSYSEGEDLANKLYEKADLLIKKEFMSNEKFYLNAQDAARSSIINLVKQLNPNVDNIKVEVEFY